MQITLAVGLDQLHELPLTMRKQIQSALRIPAEEVQPNPYANQPQYQQQPVPQYQPQVPQYPPPQAQYPQPQPQVQQYQPPAHTGPPPRLDGDVVVYPPSMGHPSQMNSSVDVLTGQPGGVHIPAAVPQVPQFNNAPVTVGPVATSGPPTVTQHPGITAMDVRRHFMSLFNQNAAPGSKELAQAALIKSGIHQLTNVNDQNAAVLWQSLQELGVR